MTSEHVIWLLIGLGVGYILWKDGKVGPRTHGRGRTVIAGENLPSPTGTAGTAHTCNTCGGAR